MKKILALLLAVLMTVAMSITATAAEDGAANLDVIAPAGAILEMNGVYYSHLQEAVMAVPVGGAATMKLLKTATDDMPVSIGEREKSTGEVANGKKIITLDLNGFTLTLKADDNNILGVYDNSELNLTGDGELNVYNRVETSTNAKVTVSNILSRGNRTDGYNGLLVWDESEITVLGDVYGSVDFAYGADNSNVKIYGDVILVEEADDTKRGDMVDASGPNSHVWIGGSVRHGDSSWYNGVFCGAGATVTVEGDVNGGIGMNGLSGTVNIHGNLIAWDSEPAIHAVFGKPHRVTIDGKVFAKSDTNFMELEGNKLARSDYQPVTTKEGYVTYSGKDEFFDDIYESYVWIKEERPGEPVTPPTAPAETKESSRTEQRDDNLRAENAAMEIVKAANDGKTGKVQTHTTAAGASAPAVPVKMYGLNASLSVDTMETLAAGKTGLNVTLDNGAAGVLVPAGFPMAREPDRLGYSLGWQKDPLNTNLMKSAVKGDNAKTEVYKLGGGTLPTTATVTLKTKLTGKINVYHWDEDTRKATLIASPTADSGKVTFAAKRLGNFILTTGTI